jgi:hypothetical protein
MKSCAHDLFSVSEPIDLSLVPPARELKETDTLRLIAAAERAGAEASLSRRVAVVQREAEA